MKSKRPSRTSPRSVVSAKIQSPPRLSFVRDTLSDADDTTNAKLTSRQHPPTTREMNPSIPSTGERSTMEPLASAPTPEANKIRPIITPTIPVPKNWNVVRVFTVLRVSANSDYGTASRVLAPEVYRPFSVSCSLSASVSLTINPLVRILQLQNWVSFFAGDPGQEPAREPHSGLACVINPNLHLDFG